MNSVRVAYFCTEIAVSQDIHTYAGGLGVVADAMAKAAYINFPMVVVTVLWRQGYYEQRLEKYGMKTEFVDYHYDNILEDTGVVVDVQVHTNPAVHIKVWRLPPEIYRTCPVYFLDTDIPKNDDLARLITRNLYEGDERRRLASEIVLGIGGVRTLRALEIHPDIFHLNEGLCVLGGVELLREQMEEKQLPFPDALKAVKKQVVFTTHTIESAGNEVHSIDLMTEMGCLAGITRKEAEELGGNDGLFNMTVCGLRLAIKANGVSRSHVKEANKIWHWVERKEMLIPVLNGVATDWQCQEFRVAKTPKEIEIAKEFYKRELLSFIVRHTGKLFSKDVFTITWARRFAAYKRPTLIFRDLSFIEQLLRTNLIQLIFAGKPHYQDLDMINRWNEIYGRCLYLPNLTILPNYEREMSLLLKAGSDAWLQSPEKPREACGTSWMAANLNGTPALSTKDGGILEASPGNFLYGTDYPIHGAGEQDYQDFLSLKETVLEASKFFYTNKEGWYQRALEAKKFAEENLTGERMLRDYNELMYTSTIKSAEAYRLGSFLLKTA